MRLPAISGIMTSLPQDPLNTSGAPRVVTGAYSYAYGEVFHSQKHFAVHTKLENRNDPDRCAVQNYKFYVSTTVLYSCQTSQVGCTLCPFLYTRSDYQ